MLILGPGQQRMQCMAKLMDQGSCTAVMQHAIWLLKAEGQGNHWCLVLPLAQLASTPQCKMGCSRKFALPACKAKPLVGIAIGVGLVESCSNAKFVAGCWSAGFELLS